MYKKETILKYNCYMGGKASKNYGLWLRLMRDVSKNSTIFKKI